MTSVLCSSFEFARKLSSLALQPPGPISYTYAHSCATCRATRRRGGAPRPALLEWRGLGPARGGTPRHSPATWYEYIKTRHCRVSQSVSRSVSQSVSEAAVWIGSLVSDED